MRFIIYTNSVLATICSIFGAACIALGGLDLIQGEMGILSAIGAIVVGLGLMVLADRISDRKERKKQEKQRAAAAAAKASTSNAGGAQSSYAQSYAQQSYAYAQPSVASAEGGKPVRKSLLCAGIFYLLASLLSLWGLYLIVNIVMKNDPHYQFQSDQVALYAMCPLLTIAAFRTRHTQNVSVLFVLGFLGMALVWLDVVLLGFRDWNDLVNSKILLVNLHSLLKLAAYFLMIIFALFSMRKIKKHLGGIVKWLWFVPFPVLLLGIVRGINYSNIPFLIHDMRVRGIRYLPRHEFMEAGAQILVALAVIFTGYAFRRICCKPAACAQPTGTYEQPRPQYANPAQPRVPCPHCHQMNDADSVFCRNCGQRIAVTAAPPKPEPPRTAPEPPAQPKPAEPVAPQADPQELQKKMQAYRDLLECGILTQEEYDRKISELKRG